MLNKIMSGLSVVGLAAMISAAPAFADVNNEQWVNKYNASYSWKDKYYNLKKKVKHLKRKAYKNKKQAVQLGPRPFFLVNDMDESPLKEKLQSCALGPFSPSKFSIGHRGAPMQFPEHTKESYVAAAKMGAGILECDVTFTKDRELVCRHSQADLHTTTNILETPLAEKCTQPFTPADPVAGTPASAECRTSDITLAEFKTLKGKMDAFNPNATTVQEYMMGTADWRTDLYSARGTLLTHAESIELFNELGVDFTPELKSPSVEMPYEGDYSQEDYARQLIKEYEEAGIAPERVWAQSFNYDDVTYWINNHSEFGKQAVYLDGVYDIDIPFSQFESWVADGVKVLAPPMWMLLDVDANGQIVPSQYAMNAKAAGLKLITWTIERSGLLKDNGGWYYQTTNGGRGGIDVIDNDGDMLEVLDVLAKDVEILGIFSDWPATTTYYANCMGLK